MPTLLLPPSSRGISLLMLLPLLLLAALLLALLLLLMRSHSGEPGAGTKGTSSCEQEDKTYALDGQQHKVFMHILLLTTCKTYALDGQLLKDRLLHYDPAFLRSCNINRIEGNNLHTHTLSHARTPAAQKASNSQ